jgi:hypothetical protein
VHGDGNDDVHDGLTVDAPFLTLEKAYMTALANPQYTRIVVLSDIAADKAIVLVGAPNQPILIKGNGAGNIKIERSGGTGDSVLAIEGGAQVKLENITINGKANGSYRALKTAGNTTKVTLGNGAVLTGQITGSGLSAATVADGSGILICDNAEVEITGTGTVTGCAETGTRAKGAVVVIGGGKLTMNGGEISHNTATGTGGSFHGALGGGVHVSGGMFTMNAGVISGNKAISSDAETNAYAFGGGVYIRSGSMFTMNGGVISDNEALNNANGSDHCAFAGRLLSMAAHLS